MGRRVLYVLGLNLAVAIAVFLLYLGYGTIGSADRAKWAFIASLTYSNAIGSLAFLMFPLLEPRIGSWRPVWAWTANGILLAVVTAAGCLLSGLVFIALGAPPDRYWAQFASGLRGALAVSFTFGVAIMIFEVMKERLNEMNRQLRAREQEGERAIKLATEARLASIESRIQPHFLFNTLNSISALIREDPARAERMVERMAALLRFALYTPEGALVPLQQEMRVVADYLEIEKERFGERLRYSIDVPEALGGIAVPPFAVQTLVENSVKHAIAPRRDGGEIRISATNHQDRLRIEVTDDGPGFSADAIREGHGLDNLRRRLDVLFGGGAGLEIRGSTTVVRLT